VESFSSVRVECAGTWDEELILGANEPQPQKEKRVREKSNRRVFNFFSPLEKKMNELRNGGKKRSVKNNRTIARGVRRKVIGFSQFR
jgi:hypothetical protein